MAKGNTKTAEATGGKGQPRPRAAVDTIDFGDAATADDLKTTITRRSRWNDLLDELYAETAKEVGSRVTRQEDGTLKFTRLGTFNNVGGARTQVKALTDKGLGSTYEFKTSTKGNQSFLWARVIEVD